MTIGRRQSRHRNASRQDAAFHGVFARRFTWRESKQIAESAGFVNLLKVYRFVTGSDAKGKCVRQKEEADGCEN